MVGSCLGWQEEDVDHTCTLLCNRVLLHLVQMQRRQLADWQCSTDLIIPGRQYDVHHDTVDGNFSTG